MSLLYEKILVGITQARAYTLSSFVRYSWGDSVTLPIQITNTGKVVAQFRFVPKLDEVRGNGM